MDVECRVTNEALWSAAPDKTGLAALETDAWVRDLVAGAPGVLFVILGRERLTWDQRFPHHWASRLDDQHLLGGLIEPGADGCFRLHGLMRSHLLAALPPGLRTELDAWLFDWFDARCQPAGPRDITPAHAAALREAVAHRDTADTQAALDWFWQRQPVFNDAARHTLLEPLVRWALALAESRLGADHRETAVALNNLAQLLQATNRLAEAEPLMRRALAIDEASYGAEHPDVAIGLNNLAQLLQATNRLTEAEPLMRRALLILLAFTRDTGHRHLNLRTVFANYRGLLSADPPPEGAQRLFGLGVEAGLDQTAWRALLAELGSQA